MWMHAPPSAPRSAQSACRGAPAGKRGRPARRSAGRGPARGPPRPPRAAPRRAQELFRLRELLARALAQQRRAEAVSRAGALASVVRAQERAAADGRALGRGDQARLRAGAAQRLVRVDVQRRRVKARPARRLEHRPVRPGEEVRKGVRLPLRAAEALGLVAALAGQVRAHAQHGERMPLAVDGPLDHLAADLHGHLHVLRKEQLLPGQKPQAEPHAPRPVREERTRASSPAPRPPRCAGGRRCAPGGEQLALHRQLAPALPRGRGAAGAGQSAARRGRARRAGPRRGRPPCAAAAARAPCPR